jgi:DNA mismatch repair protein MutL
VSSTFNPFKPEVQQQESFSELYVETDAQQIRIDGQTAVKEDLWNLDSLKAFQWANKFIVVSSADKLLVIDQYRAHQRVLYEAFLKKMTVEHIGSQQLLFQEFIALQPQEWVLFETIESHLIDLGFEFERSAESLIIKGVPEFFPPNESGSVFKRLIEEAESLSSVLSYSTADMAAKVLAKHSAVKKGVALSAEAITELITDLSRCKEPYLSPFNKRIFVTVQEAEIIQKLH